jgi:hypothetical protein
VEVGIQKPRSRKSANVPNIRNFGILIALMIFGCFVYLVATEFISAKKSKGEVLLFRRGQVPQLQKGTDEEAKPDDRITVDVLAQGKAAHQGPTGLHQQTGVFQWNDVTYDIKVKKEQRRLLDHVDGWIKPGTLTALMVCECCLVSTWMTDDI